MLLIPDLFINKKYSKFYSTLSLDFLKQFIPPTVFKPVEDLAILTRKSKISITQKTMLGLINGLTS